MQGRERVLFTYKNTHTSSWVDHHISCKLTEVPEVLDSLTSITTVEPVVELFPPAFFFQGLKSEAVLVI